MFIEVKSTNVTNVRPYREKQYGEQQAALVIPGNDYPLPFKLNVEADRPHAPGRYAFDASSFGTDQHNNLRLNRVRLGAAIPVSAATAKAA
jgi:hypothetical protein